MPHFLRAIRFDPSDTHVFTRAALPDEWAVPGSAVFACGAYGPLADIKGKGRQAFVSGFLGIGSFGFSTLVCIGEARPDEVEATSKGLAGYFLSDCGAPDVSSARQAAQDEVSYALELAADVPLNTLLAMRREVDETGNIREQFSVVSAPGETPHARIWDVVEEE
ncbi:hypothetical protein J0X15_07390 [Roseibium sp. CAU 1637]|uniref:Uncharacterized protein n=1 Tax=Roseibium limicola TaxID=2816037 RepID=A0A939J881_9HYPH|nr:DUF6505 family protein [Roseibium limicola]MBO0345036.1 hypothetical protein [Roseibium limicola]